MNPLCTAPSNCTYTIEHGGSTYLVLWTSRSIDWLISQLWGRGGGSLSWCLTSGWHAPPSLVPRPHLAHARRRGIVSVKK